ncbi:MAG: TonB-dependent receptor, partial [Chitinophagia bacterium]|nr:TonB-dependent receptor [Chitinophagia bacterium]
CLQGDDYSDDNPHQADILWFHNLTAGIFAQSTIIISPKTTFEAGLRLDLPKNYAAKLMPRIAFFHKFNENWGTRWGVGTGYKLPQPFAAQDIDNVPLSVKWSGLSPEKSIGANAEVNYKCEWDKKTSLFVNQSFFYTGIENPIRYQYDSANYLSLINASKSVTTMGADLYAKLALHTWEIYLGFTYTLAKQHYDTVQPYIPLSPISRFATVISKKIAKKIDACIEGSYVGMQYLPTGNTTPSYVLLAAMCRYKAGEHITVMLNAENLFNYNMWKTQPVFSGSITMPTFNAVWSPIDGRVINISCRWQW